MRCTVREEPGLGRVLWMTDGRTEVGAALDYGIRILHLSCAGMENLFYRQPGDLSDGFATARGWQLRGGHRLWLAPESEKSYWPDNQCVTWSHENDSVLLVQEPDPALGVRKRICVTFAPDGQVMLEHGVENLARQSLRCALWGISTLDGGGTARVPFGGAAGSEYMPHSVVSLWGDTSLGDARLTFGPGQLTARHMAAGGYCKLGLSCRAGHAELENKGQRLTLTFPAGEPAEYPDLGCNFELYLCRQFMELETLGPLCRIAPGAHAAYAVCWRVEALPE